MKNIIGSIIVAILLTYVSAYSLSDMASGALGFTIFLWSSLGVVGFIFLAVNFIVKEIMNNEKTN